jgi:hypothetical protein
MPPQGSRRGEVGDHHRTYVRSLVVPAGHAQPQPPQAHPLERNAAPRVARPPRASRLSPARESPNSRPRVARPCQARTRTPASRPVRARESPNSRARVARSPGASSPPVPGSEPPLRAGREPGHPRVAQFAPASRPIPGRESPALRPRPRTPAGLDERHRQTDLPNERAARARTRPAAQPSHPMPAPPAHRLGRTSGTPERTYRTNAPLVRLTRPGHPRGERAALPNEPIEPECRSRGSRGGPSPRQGWTSGTVGHTYRASAPLRPCGEHTPRSGPGLRRTGWAPRRGHATSPRNTGCRSSGACHAPDLGPGSAPHMIQATRRRNSGDSRATRATRAPTPPTRTPESGDSRARIGRLARRFRATRGAPVEES